MYDEIINLLFLDLSLTNDEFRENYDDALWYLDSLPKIKRFPIKDISKARSLIAEIRFDILLIWLNQENAKTWQEILEVAQTVHHQNGIGVIIAFGFREGVQDKAREAMLNDIYAFACPFNPNVLGAYIEAIAFNVSQENLVKTQFERLIQANSRTRLVANIFNELGRNPITEFQRATISLMDASKNRYLFGYRAGQTKPDRQLLKNVSRDPLMTAVETNGIYYLDDLQKLRNHGVGLDGWEDTGATSDINSWVGIALTHADQTIGFITLDHKEPGYYTKYGDRAIKYLEMFRKNVGNAIDFFYQTRNTQVLDKIIAGAGDDLQSEKLVREILLKLKAYFDCNNCTFFRVSSSLERKTPVQSLEEWVGANDLAEIQNAGAKRYFRKGDGIVGKVLADGKSRIIAHALEDEEFEPTPRLSGSNLSMLAVPVYSSFLIDADNKLESEGNRIIGVIVCYKLGATDYFTTYDQYLLSMVAQRTASLIERTTLLEYIDEISRDINNLEYLDNFGGNNSILEQVDGKAIILEKICKHALRVTSAIEAVIHQIEPADDGKAYRTTGAVYNYPKDADHPPPRLDGSGATDLVIEKKTIVQFSEKENYERLSEKIREKGVKHAIGIPLTVKQEKEEKIVGVLHLNKYEEGRFTQVEEFSLGLFARQAAIAINNQNFLAERNFLAETNIGLASAIEVIARSTNQKDMLRKIVLQAHQLVGGDFIYFALVDKNKVLKFVTAWPDHILVDLELKLGDYNLDEGNPNFSYKIGVTGLAILKGETIVISDLKEEKRQEELAEISKPFNYQDYYIPFQKETRSELVVPIKKNTIKEEEVIGVINLESKNPYYFSELHRTVIELFARQVAIALQKNTWLDKSESQKERLKKLQQAVQEIETVEHDEMLLKAVRMTCEAIEASAVIFIPIRKETISWSIDDEPSLETPLLSSPKTKLADLIIDPEKIVTNVGDYLAQKNNLAQKDKILEEVYFSQKLIFIPNFEKWKEDVDNQGKINPALEKVKWKSGLCLPLLSKKECIGVMWIHFSEIWDENDLADEETVLQAYANQIALAYTNANQAAKLRKRLDDAQTDISNNIQNNYQHTSDVAKKYARLSTITSTSGVVVIIAGLIIALLSFIHIIPLVLGASLAIFGVLLELATVMIFRREDVANERMDKYHKELYRIRQLNILLTVSEQLNTEAEIAKKASIIGTVTQSWFSSNTDQVEKVKNKDLPNTDKNVNA